MIWSSNGITPAMLNDLGKDTMSAFLGLEFSEVGPDYVVATMPVDSRTRQPFGLLHGGASCVLAETLGSVASAMVVDQRKFRCVGLEINANHIGSAKDGLVTGRAVPVHLARSTHVWDFLITNDSGKLLCISRLTVAVLPL